MTFDPTTEEYVLSNGKRFRAHQGALSISEGESAPFMLEGWDGGLQGTWEGNTFVPFTQAECAEIATHMAARWHEWSANWQPEEGETR